MESKSGLRTWVEVSRSAIANNYGQFRKLLSPKTKIMAVVKSNAYGHGLWDFALLMQKLGADFLAVDSIVEGVRLREKGVTIPLLVLGYTLPEKLDDAVKHNISLGVSTFETLGTLRSGERELMGLKIHLKIDTGMHRQGFLSRDVPAALDFIKDNLKNVVLEGVFTHFSSADELSRMESTEKQIEEFDKIVLLVKSLGFDPIIHASNTAGIIRGINYDMVRIGKGMYGYYPSPAMKKEYTGKINLIPVLTWKTVVSEIKRLPEGGTVGYNETERLPPGSVLAVLPVGYWHGYSRRVFSGVGRVKIKGKFAKVVGRVSMDMTSVLVTSIPGVNVLDEVELISKDISADDLALEQETINYEILTHINPLIERIYVS
ncbi:MAG: alanine racemase [Candidatus Vogelbacteria bacterium CG10_big_fil_rev_8_21_14_0_10_45_14]|uniref:Alanine racemase n=1 Tax=Candidatus Vogelbacteria bacterium CG10_big_fil_rev_8_21_14_0_10_45_14 TaxID=1975042 RepID=A0A2H0RJL4_9BACT|nr:MAG: alanine racemase [Candidatus Vogelbacteria bacterium CG10_big_fil_rev_8_21_14_0_10_45_14]